jgi:hypothetical protein
MIGNEIDFNHQTAHDILTEELGMRTLGSCITTPRHTAISVKEFLTKKGKPVVPQPPYSPDLSSCNFFPLPKLKFHLKGRHFGTVDNIQKVVIDQLRALPHEDSDNVDLQFSC